MKNRLKVRRSGQVFLPGLSWAKKDIHGGGNTRTNHPKSPRPFHSRAFLHIVIRSEKAKGKLSLLRHETRIRGKIVDIAAKCFVEVKDHVNAGNHIHFLVKSRSREGLNAFLRAVTGVVARIATGRERGGAASGRAAGGPAAGAASGRIGVGSKPSGLGAGGERSGLGARAPSESFWDARPFSRIVASEFDRRGIVNYFIMNRTEVYDRVPREISRARLAEYEKQKKFYGKLAWVPS